MCGARLGEGYVFCNRCGIRVGYAPYFPYQPAAKKAGTGIIIGIVATSVVLFTAIILLIIVSAGGTSASVVGGEWLLQSTNDEDYSFITDCRMEFLADGTGTMYFIEFDEMYVSYFNWHLVGNDLFFDGHRHVITRLSSGVLEYEYEHDGVRLWWRFTRQ
jgi:hypothetical protein